MEVGIGKKEGKSARAVAYYNPGPPLLPHGQTVAKDCPPRTRFKAKPGSPGLITKNASMNRGDNASSRPVHGGRNTELDVVMETGGNGRFESGRQSSYSDLFAPVRGRSSSRQAVLSGLTRKALQKALLYARQDS
jgi:hypothetical protein